MFSRSEKTDEVPEAFGDESDQQRSPMAMAALAGLLAIAGAFLLVWYLSGGGDDAADGGEQGSLVASDGTQQQVLVATQRIPRGTTVEELIEAPTAYLTARAVPAEFVTQSAITSVAELQDILGLTLSSDVLPDDQLRKDKFVDLSNFNNESFLEASTVVDAPDGHHQVVVLLPAFRALGGNVRPGDTVTVIGGFSVETLDADGESTGKAAQASLVILPSVEVVNVQASSEVTGSFAQTADQVGIASQGNFAITLAVEPDELTDLTYAMEYGQLMLAVAIEGANNDDTPRAVTTIEGIIGDDGVWLAEVDDGNLVDLLNQSVTGSSIEVETPAQTDEDTAADATDAGDS